MKKIIALMVLGSLFGCSTYSGGERTPANEEKAELSGTFFMTSLPLPSDRETAKLKNKLSSENEELVKGLDLSHLRRLKRFGGEQQIKSRVLGLNYCREKGFYNVGAVFWSAQSFIGAYCMGSDEQRFQVLSMSYSAGCKALNIQSPACKNIRKNAPYEFTHIEDERVFGNDMETE
jgi:hypothetical protein